MDRKKVILIVVFLILLELRFVYTPLRKKIISLDKTIVAKQKDRETLIRQCEEYKQKAGKEAPLRIARKEFSLLSYTGNLIEKRNLEKNITGLQPLRTDKKGAIMAESVRIGLKGITLQQLYEFLYDIEKSQDGIYIPEFRMQKVKDAPHLLDVEIELLTLKEVG